MEAKAVHLQRSRLPELSGFCHPICTHVARINIEKVLTRCRESRKKLLITSPDVSTTFGQGKKPVEGLNLR